MFHVYKLNLARSRRLPEIVNIQLARSGRLAITKGNATGEILCPALTPRLARQWVGFNVQGRNGDESGVTIALKRYEGQYQSWNGTRWVDSPIPIYYTAAEIRSRIGTWLGTNLQFRLKLTRSVDGISPEVAGVRVGCQLIGNVLDYAVNTMLPIALADHYPLRRVARVSNGVVPLPSGLQIERMGESHFMTVPEAIVYPVETASNQLKLTGVSAGEFTGFLLFPYKPLCKAAPKGGIEQITQSPCVIIRPNEYRNVFEVMADEWVRTGDIEAALSRSLYQVDLQLDVTVIGDEMEDVRAIAKGIVNKFRDNGGLYLPAYDMTIGIKPEGYLQEQTSDSTMIKGSLNTARLKLVLLKVPETQEAIGRSGLIKSIRVS